jgi:cytochrome c biogenesis protein CcmG, thiol:disulfide interchange protein DsbE
MGCAKLRAMRRFALLMALLAVAGCDSGEESEPVAGRAGVQHYIAGGRAEFESFIEKQRGKPVVVNKWASWCGPCRAEFPYFRSQAEKREGQVVFVGVNSNDNDADALEFLQEFPVPFKHFKDPDLEVAASFNGVQAFPTTAYYDSKGKLAFVHQGGYASEAKLAEDIDQYAR